MFWCVLVCYLHRGFPIATLSSSPLNAHVEAAAITLHTVGKLAGLIALVQDSGGGGGSGCCYRHQCKTS